MVLAPSSLINFAACPGGVLGCIPNPNAWQWL
jgi:hypothetical protein